MKITPLSHPEILAIEPRVFADDRGFFLETYRETAFAEAGLPTSWTQDNHSRSSRGVLRGLHYQLHNPQGKLVRVARGRVFDVGVDLRRSSPRFGQWAGTLLDDESLMMLWIPPGFGHGFLTLSETADFQYKCTTAWDAASDRSLAWNDPELGIDWPLDGIEPRLAPKDAAAPGLAQAEVFP